MCCSCFTCDQRSINPRCFHAASTSAPTVYLSPSPSPPQNAYTDALGSHTAVGIEKSIHHTPLGPIARRSENVQPCICVTGTRASRSRRMPTMYPDAMPCDEIRDVARKNAVMYALCAGLW